MTTDKTSTARPLKTFRIVLDITQDASHYANPSDWDWETILDPNLQAGFWFEVKSVDAQPLNAEHAERIAYFEREAED